jgi:hypothetical protein
VVIVALIRWPLKEVAALSRSLVSSRQHKYTRNRREIAKRGDACVKYHRRINVAPQDYRNVPGTLNVVDHNTVDLTFTVRWKT